MGLRKTSRDDDSEILFSERLSLPWYLIFSVSVLFVVITISTFFFNRDEIFDQQQMDSLEYSVSILISLILVFALSMAVLTAPIKTTVNKSKVRVQQRFSFKFDWPFDSIETAKPYSLKKAKEDHGRFSFLSPHILQDRGVLIALSDGKFSFVCSNKPQELADVINDGRKQFEYKKYE